MPHARNNNVREELWATCVRKCLGKFYKEKERKKESQNEIK
jgi:hypothetical protein